MSWHNFIRRRSLSLAALKLGMTCIIVLLGLVYLLHILKTECTPAQREIAITIDDLPLVDNAISDEHGFDQIVQGLMNNNAPATGFVIAKNVNAKQFNILKQFKEKGFTIGNHSYSHIRLGNTSFYFYINDIANADKILSPLMTDKKYYRYPYLSQGKWLTKQKVHDYLASLNYTIAPITVDSRDFILNAEFLKSKERANPQYLEKIKQHYLNFVWKQTVKAEQQQSCKPTKQILLIHANILNSYFLNDLLKMYAAKGYRFISLTEALKPSQA